MKIVLSAVALMAALLCAAVPGWTQEPDMPPVLEQELGLIEGCTVVQSTQVHNAETCDLNCGGMHPNQVATQYKRIMDSNGYKPTTLGASNGGALASGEKQGATTSVWAVKDDGFTRAVMSIDNIVPLGGTPVDPQAPAAAPQAEEPQTEAVEPGTNAADQAVASTAQAATDGSTTEAGATEAGAASADQAVGQGLAAEIWELVEPRPGDTLIEELMLHNHPVAIFSTQAGVGQVLDYYRDALLNLGWMKVSQMMEADSGIVIMVTKGQQIQIIYEQDVHPDSPGPGYSIMLAKAKQ